MTEIREIVWTSINRAYDLVDYTIHDTLYKRHEFRKQIIIDDENLTDDEKLYIIFLLYKDYDYYKIINNEGTKRNCENCRKKCLAQLYCEHCVRNYLIKKFPSWTSGNKDIDNLIRRCQKETFSPLRVIEWIPFKHLQNVEYLTKGGYSNIYKAIWKNGRYDEWDLKKKQLTRLGEQYVILKELENVENADNRWFEEVCN
jgi:transcriptional regulator of met regulon